MGEKSNIEWEYPPLIHKYVSIHYEEKNNFI